MEINETNKYNTKDIAKWVRETLRQKFKDLKFSVRCEYYSMGSSIHVAIMKSNKTKFIIDPEKLTEDNISNSILSGRTMEQLRRMQVANSHQLNQYTLREKWKPGSWCNGVFLTEKGHNVLQKILEIANKYNYDNSDSRMDYFDVNYYLHLNLGKWDNPFIDGGN